MGGRFPLHPEHLWSRRSSIHTQLQDMSQGDAMYAQHSRARGCPPDPPDARGTPEGGLPGPPLLGRITGLMNQDSHDTTLKICP